MKNFIFYFAVLVIAFIILSVTLGGYYSVLSVLGGFVAGLLTQYLKEHLFNAFS